MIQCENLQWGCGFPLTPPLTLNLDAGSLTIIRGDNGVGKSTLLKVLSGLQVPYAGRVNIAANRFDIAYLQQQQAIDRQFPIRVVDLVAAGLWRQSLARKAFRKAIDAALDDWQLLHLAHQSLASLSGGELQRSLLARLGLLNARLMLLDEPDTGLDRASQDLLWHHLGQWQKQSRTILVVSHRSIENLFIPYRQLFISPQGCYLDEVFSVDFSGTTESQVA